MICIGKRINAHKQACRSPFSPCSQRLPRWPQITTLNSILRLHLCRGALTAHIGLHYDCGKVMINLRAIVMSLSEIPQLDAKIPIQNRKCEFSLKPQKTHKGVVLLPISSFTALEVQRGNAALRVKQGTACQTLQGQQFRVWVGEGAWSHLL